MLVNLSPNIKGAFLHYPKTHLRQILQNLPDLLGGLICLTWALNTISPRYLDWPLITDWLRAIYAVDEASIVDHWTFFRTDYLEILYELADVVEDLSRITKLYTESTLAILDTVSPPEASHSTIELSSTEYNRIASAFSLLRIYRQYLQYRDGQHEFRSIVPAWQIEEMMTVNYFLRGIGQATRSPLYYLVDQKHRCGNVLRDSSYHVWSYYAHGPWTVEYETRMPTTQAQNSSIGIQSICDSECRISHPTFLDGKDIAMRIAERSPNYAQKNIQEITAEFGLFSYYNSIFVQLGMFFWDDDRFLYVPLTCASDYEALVARFEVACDKGKIKAYDSLYRGGTFSGYHYDKIHGYQVHPEDIKAWTRCDFQCTFGEWMVGHHDTVTPRW